MSGSTIPAQAGLNLLLSESFEERRRRFVLNLSLVLAVLLLFNACFSGYFFITKGTLLSLFNSFVSLVADLICLTSWLLARKERTSLAAWLLLSATLATATLLFLTNLTTVILYIAFLTIATLALIILNVLVAYAVLGWGTALLIFAWITTNLQYTTTDESSLVKGQDVLSYVLIEAVTFWLMAYLASNLNRANKLVSQQASTIAQALNDVQKKREVGEDVSRKIFSVTTELNATASQQAMGSEQQASALTQLTAFAQEIAQTAGQIALKAERLAEAAGEIKTANQQAKDAASEVVTTGENGAVEIQHLYDSNLQVSELYSELREILASLAQRQGQIQAVVSTIKNISEETHLLALNAAIEAAGTGEFGERFKVVAQEVKQLATRSRQASQEVGTILGQVEEGINRAVHTTETGYNEMQTAVATVQNTSVAINKLLENIQENASRVTRIEQATQLVTEQIYDINQASRQQYSASTQALQSLQDIGTIALQNANGSREVTKSASSLEQLSHGLITALVA